MSRASDPWLTVVGIDDSGPASLPPRALALVEAAEVLVGGERHHALFDHIAAERLVWQSPIERSLDAIEARRGRRVVELFQICIADPDNHIAAWEADEALRELELILQSSDAEA